MSDLAHFVRVYDDALPADLCDAVVERFDLETAHHTGPGGIPEGDLHGDAESRWTELNIERLDSWADIRPALVASTQEFGRRYAEDCRVGLPPRAKLEDYRIKRYDASRGDHFRPHLDADSLGNAKRFLVFFWYVADVADGGETTFPDLDIAVPPKKGRLLMFPPFWMYPHAGLPPRSGPKYILGTYLTYAV